MAANTEGQVPASGRGIGTAQGSVPANRLTSQDPHPRRPGLLARLIRPGVGLTAVLLFQLLFASMFLSVLHHPVPHGAPVAVAGESPVASAVARHGDGLVRLTGAPDAAAAEAAVREPRPR